MKKLIYRLFGKPLDTPPWMIVKNGRLAVDKYNKDMWRLRIDMIKYNKGEIKEKPFYKDYYDSKENN